MFKAKCVFAGEETLVEYRNGAMAPDYVERRVKAEISMLRELGASELKVNLIMVPLTLNDELCAFEILSRVARPVELIETDYDSGVSNPDIDC